MSFDEIPATLFGRLVNLDTVPTLVLVMLQCSIGQGINPLAALLILISVALRIAAMLLARILRSGLTP